MSMTVKSLQTGDGLRAPSHQSAVESRFPSSKPLLRPSLPILPLLLISSFLAVVLDILHSPNILSLVKYNTNEISDNPIRPPEWHFTATCPPPLYTRNATQIHYINNSITLTTHRDLTNVLTRIRQVHQLATNDQQLFDYGNVTSTVPKSGYAVDLLPNSREAATYTLLKQPIDPIWLDAVARVPIFTRNQSQAAYVQVIRNAYYGTCGIAYNARTATAYDIGGGCCVSDWHINRKFLIDDEARQSFRQDANATVLVLAQHHGVTYHHVLFEVVPRYLAVRQLIDAIPDMKIVIDDSDVGVFLLTLLGLDARRIIRTGPDHPFRFAKMLLYPPPLYQDHNSTTYFHPLSAERAVAVLLKGIVSSYDEQGTQHLVELLSQIPFTHDKEELEKALAQIEPKLPRRCDRPSIVILERAVSRTLSGICDKSRCMRNFRALVHEIRSKFGSLYEIKVYPALATTAKAISFFDGASIVVGMHGGGFQNLMFCRPGTDAVHIGWHYHYKITADNFGVRYHSVIMPEINRESRNIMVDVAEITSLMEEIVERRKGT